MRVLRIGNKDFEVGKKTIIMGILNVTPDSFSDGGNFFTPEEAIKHAISMEKQGADIIDIGGESTRPGANAISLDEEMNRVIPILEVLLKKISIPISVDTYKSEVAKKALDIGASMINDITALRGDKNLVRVIADYSVPICLMHMKGKPRSMQVNPFYEDVVKEIYDFLKGKANYATSHGIKKNNIIIDPGIGFGKRTGKGIEDNCEILRRLSELKDLGFPIMVGTSRKSFIGNICGGNKPLPVEDRLEGSLVTACIAVANSADIIRVHDIKETKQCVDIIDYIVR